ncbi:hypothetical protein PO124_22880 [Bacillus licheniformis]|nr:hypothetical protein [Bacillus licheniformis]
MNKRKQDFNFKLAADLIDFLTACNSGEVGGDEKKANLTGSRSRAEI